MLVPGAGCVNGLIHIATPEACEAAGILVLGPGILGRIVQGGANSVHGCYVRPRAGLTFNWHGNPARTNAESNKQSICRRQVLDPMTTTEPRTVTASPSAPPTAAPMFGLLTPNPSTSPTPSPSPVPATASPTHHNDDDLDFGEEGQLSSPPTVQPAEPPAELPTVAPSSASSIASSTSAPPATTTAGQAEPEYVLVPGSGCVNGLIHIATPEACEAAGIVVIGPGVSVRIVQGGASSVHGCYVRPRAGLTFNTHGNPARTNAQSNKQSICKRQVLDPTTTEPRTVVVQLARRAS